LLWKVFYSWRYIYNLRINVYIMDCPIPVPPEAGLEVGTPASIHQHDGLEVNWGATKSGLHGAWTASDVEAESAVKGKPSRRCQRETILGLRVAWFWAVIVVLVILLAGGVGGGIAGGVARRESSVDQGSRYVSLEVSFWLADKHVVKHR
jgi:hypothetical protein